MVIPHVINKYTQKFRSIRKLVESLKIASKTFQWKATLLPLSLTFREFHNVAAAMADVLVPACFL